MKIFFVDYEEHATDSSLAFWQMMQDMQPDLNIPVTNDSLVAAYTSLYNLSCPIVNYDGYIPGYEVNGGPSYFMICPNRDYHYITGFSILDGVSDITTHKFACEGADLSSDVGIMSVDSEPDYCVFSEEDEIELVSLEFTFNIKLAEPFISADSMITELYQVAIYINGEYIETQDKDPLADGLLAFYDVVEMSSIIVQPGDSVTFVLIYPDDSYEGNNTLEFVVPANISQTQTANSNDLTLFYNATELPTPDPNFPGDYPPGTFYFSIKKDNQYIYNQIPNIDGEPYSINLEDGNCYKIKFNNQQKFGPKLVDASNNTLVQLNPYAFFPVDYTPWLFFNVDADGDGNVSINQQTLDNQIVKIEYYDLLARKISDTFSDLPKGLFVELKHFKNKVIQSQKVIKLKN